MTGKRRDRLTQILARRLDLGEALRLNLDLQPTRNGDSQIYQCRLTDKDGKFHRINLLRGDTQGNDVDVQVRLERLLRPDVERMLAEQFAQVLE